MQYNYMLHNDIIISIGVTAPTGGNIAAVVGGSLLVVVLSVLVLILLLVIIIKKRKSGKFLIEDCLQLSISCICH